MIGAVVFAAIALLPPGDLQPTHATLRQVLSAHRLAVGTLKVGVAHTRIESWKISRGGLSGTESEIASGEDYRDDITLGPFQSASGSIGGRQWEQNANGLTRVLSGLHGLDAADTTALAHPNAPGSGVTLAGEVPSPTPAYVVRVAPAGGRVEYLFYEKKNGLITRRERDVLGKRDITTYDDFRATDGLTEAWHIHTTNGMAYDDTDNVLQSLSFGSAVDKAKLAIPPDTRSIVALTGKTPLPVRLLFDRVIVTVEIAGRRVNLQLDSGASQIVIDRSVLDALKVPTYGQNTEITAGEYVTARALVPEIKIGSAVMQNIAVMTTPFQMVTDQGPVAGLLGYDFLEGCVVHIDYLNGTVEAISYDSFSPPAQAVVVPIALDDGIPIIAAHIGASVGNYFALDTGADRSIIFAPFAQAHPSDVVDQGLGSQIVDSFPFGMNVQGVGGEISIRPVQVASVGLGSVTLPRPLFDMTDDPYAFSAEGYDGLIGQDVLRYFDVYFDYRHAKVYLVPNDRYHQRYG